MPKKGYIFTEVTKKKLKIARAKRINELSPAWKGGYSHNGGGYALVRVVGHPKAKKRGYYVLKHRYIMEKHLGRYLEDTEVVDHINGIKNDNRIENLRLFKSQSDRIKEEGKRGKMKKDDKWAKAISNSKIGKPNNGAVQRWVKENGTSWNKGKCWSLETREKMKMAQQLRRQRDKEVHSYI